MSEDYYEILGVSRDASLDEIKHAYKKLAKKYHPDLHQGNKEYEEKFKKINEAYKVLSDAKLREQYDRFGTTDSSQAGFDFSGFGDDFFSDIFENFFGGSFFGRKRKRKEEIEVEIAITLKEAARGTEKTISIPSYVVCDRCNGTGAYSPEDIETCPLCHGSGVIHVKRSLGFGMFTTTQTCYKCNGTGKIIKKKCPKCHGTGKIRENIEYVVEIPSGIDNGDVIRKVGKEQIIYIHVRVLPHPSLRREGLDLIYEAEIPFTTAALGGKVEVPTLEGNASVKIPGGIEPDAILRMKGKGVFDSRTRRRGDELIIVKITVPKRLTRKQREMLEELHKTIN